MMVLMVGYLFAQARLDRRKLKETDDATTATPFV
jgi:hypothetical protein